MCEGYSSGLIFGGDDVPAMLELMIRRKRDWVDVACRASGYDHTVVAQLYAVVLDRAAADGCSHMEGDELVGACGYRLEALVFGCQGHPVSVIIHVGRYIEPLSGPSERSRSITTPDASGAARSCGSNRARHERPFRFPR
jgi:hypothetical protein